MTPRPDDHADLHREYRQVSADLADLARLSLHGSRRDVEILVHRLAYRYRAIPLGAALAKYDVVPPVSLRGQSGGVKL